MNTSFEFYQNQTFENCANAWNLKGKKNFFFLYKKCKQFQSIDTEDEFRHLRTTSLAIFSGINLMLRLTLGTLLYIAIIHYERFGEDPKKRTLTNRIIISICIGFLANIWIAHPITDWSILVGPTPKILAQFFLLQRGAVAFIIFLGLAEIVILKNLMLFKFNFMALINEQFCARIILVWNLMFAYIYELSLVYINSIPIYEFEFLTGRQFNGK